MESLEHRDARIDRMKVEAAQLGVRIKAASDFIESALFVTTSDLEQQLLINQVLAMQSYLGILRLRIDLATD